MEETNLSKGKYHHHGKTVKLTHGYTYYEDQVPRGDIKGTVVMIHGLTWWSFCFDDIVPSFISGGYRVITFDLYGRGNSDAATGVINDHNFFAEQTLELIEEVVGKDQKIILVGLSLGGAVATYFTSKHPHLVKALVAMGPAGIKVPLPFITELLKIPFFGTALYNMLGKHILLSGMSSTRLKENFYLFEKLDQSGQVDHLIKRSEWLINEKEGFLESFLSTILNFPFSGLETEFKKIPSEVPVLCLWGKYDEICPTSSLPLFIEAIPQAKGIILEDAGHCFIYEYPELTWNHIQEFLVDLQ